MMLDAGITKGEYIEVCNSEKRKKGGNGEVTITKPKLVHYPKLLPRQILKMSERL